ncbi:MAG: hypothetical protein Aurels2KO_06680 [Aureliella sp.]
MDAAERNLGEFVIEAGEQFADIAAQLPSPKGADKSQTCRIPSSLLPALFKLKQQANSFGLTQLRDIAQDFGAKIRRMQSGDGKLHNDEVVSVLRSIAVIRGLLDEVHTHPPKVNHDNVVVEPIDEDYDARQIINEHLEEIRSSLHQHAPLRPAQQLSMA